MNIGNRNQFIDIMRGIAMLLVVLGHTMTGCTTGAEESFVYNIVWSLQMPLFILISGFVTKFSRGISDAAGLWRYVKRRTVAYLLPWAVWSFIVRGIIFGERNFLNIKWLLWHMDSGYWFLATIWTISMAFGTSTFLAKKATKGTEGKQQIVILLLYIVGMGVLVSVGFIAGFSFFAIKLTLYYMPFYFIGYLYGQYRDMFLEIKWGKTAEDVAVGVCLAAWLLIMTRVHLYALPDSGMALILRAASSITGCIAVCGLCKGFFDITPKSIRESDSQSNNNTGYGGFDHCVAGSEKSHQIGYTEKIVNKNHVWRTLLNWSGVHSLEIYLTHYLLLSLLKVAVAPTMGSIQGTALVISNYVVTVALTVLAVKLLNTNKVLRLVLYGSKG